MRCFIFILSYFIIHPIYAQIELTLFSTSNGIQAVNQNPAAIAHMQTEHEINIFSIDGGYYNSLFYLPDPLHSMKTGIGFAFKYPNVDSTDWSNLSSAFSPSITHFTNIGRANIYQTIQGPSYQKRMMNGAWAISYHLRSQVCMQNVPYNLARLIWQRMDYPMIYGSELKAENLSIAGMSWSEFAFTRSYKIHIPSSTKQSFWGISPRLLIGHQAYVFNCKQTSVIANPDSSINFGHTEIDIIRNTNSQLLSGIKGWGLACNFGYQLLHTKPISNNSGACPDFKRIRKYNYTYSRRLDIALNDLGCIQFNDELPWYHLKSDGFVWNRFDSTITADPDHLNGQIINKFYQNIQNSNVEKSNPPVIGLATRLRISYEQIIRSNFIVGFVWQQRLPLFFNAQLIASNSLCVYAGAGIGNVKLILPFSYYEYNIPSLGLMLRSPSFYMGVDALESLFGRPFNSFLFGVYVGYSYRFSVKRYNYPRNDF